MLAALTSLHSRFSTVTLIRSMNAGRFSTVTLIRSREKSICSLMLKCTWLNSDLSVAIAFVPNDVTID